MNHNAELLGTLGNLRQELEAVRGQLDAIPPEFAGELPYRIDNSMVLLGRLASVFVSAGVARDAGPTPPKSYAAPLTKFALRAPDEAHSGAVRVARGGAWRFQVFRYGGVLFAQSLQGLPWVLAPWLH